MVNSMLGDIVTASKLESVLISLLSIAFILFYFFQAKIFLKESIDIALFSEEKQKRSHQLVLIIFMSLSVHILGLVFTLSMLLMTPIFVLMNRMKSLNTSTALILVFNGLSVVIGFSGLGLNDRIPTSVMIVLSLLIMNLIFYGAQKIRS